MKYLIRTAGGIVAVGVLVSNVLVLQKVSKVEADVAEIREEVNQVRGQVRELQKVVLYKTQERVQLSDREMQCLAKNIYHEAGVEDRAGKVAVAQVTLNRLKSGRWGNDLCKVVYAKAQFSWTLSRKKRDEKPKGELWNQSVRVAYEFAQGKRVKGLEDSHFYHTDYIAKPNWAHGMKVVHKVGQHIFYQHRT